jgi:hypothetical protein
METIRFGNPARFTETFRNLVTGALADPSVISLKLRGPSAVETVYTLAGGDIVRDSEGVYHFDQTFSLSGEWSARWVAGGTFVAAHEFRFRVEASAFSSP